METTTTEYLFKLPKKNTEKMRLKIISLKRLIENFVCIRFNEDGNNQFTIQIDNFPSTMIEWASIMDMMDYIFMNDNLELIATHTENRFKNL